MGFMGRIDLESKKTIGTSISKEQNMFVAEHLLSDIVGEHGQHPAPNMDGGCIWCPQAFRFFENKVSSSPYLRENCY
jgi:hypothetical protein